jgi:hypothetical protein
MISKTDLNNASIGELNQVVVSENVVDVCYGRKQDAIGHLVAITDQDIARYDRIDFAEFKRLCIRDLPACAVVINGNTKRDLFIWRKN